MNENKEIQGISKKMRKYGRLHINDSSVRMYMPTGVIPPTESLSYSERPQPD